MTSHDIGKFIIVAVLESVLVVIGISGLFMTSDIVIDDGKTSQVLYGYTWRSIYSVDQPTLLESNYTNISVFGRRKLYYIEDKNGVRIVFTDRIKRLEDLIVLISTNYVTR